MGHGPYGGDSPRAEEATSVGNTGLGGGPGDPLLPLGIPNLMVEADLKKQDFRFGSAKFNDNVSS